MHNLTILGDGEGLKSLTMLPADQPITAGEVTMTPRQAAEILSHNYKGSTDFLDPALANGFQLRVAAPLHDSNVNNAVAVLSEYFRQMRRQSS